MLFVETDNVYYQYKYLSIPLSILIIGTIGFIDDYKGSPIHIRLTLFFICCFLSTSALTVNILPGRKNIYDINDINMYSNDGTNRNLTNITKKILY